ncbi:MAG: hypothetical protein FD145_1028 [Candidatus Saganbacteria bacterium]|uniref:Diadenylate cyclase n=1 Tax=Candidatus Saganbacteria bacterium TaxID=2575572 RepID=A0A833L0Q0_UNCSA|nr:MAG: hypothetical protein FD145_1028 [Candidatus Saganbacteria bacterium]
MQLSWLLNILDIAIVSVFLYYIVLWLRGTQAFNLIRGLVILLSIYVGAKLMGLQTINWLFEKFAAAILVVLIIVFQPELRRTLERLGRGIFLKKLGFTPSASSRFIRELVKAIEWFSENKVGAIIAIERNSGLSNYIETGTRIDGILTSEILISIFQHQSIIHDGAVIIQGDRISAASCLFPLSESKLLDKRLGTRHRAAVGLTEASDALVIVVSETSGMISIAENGYLTQSATRELLEEKVFLTYGEQFPEVILPWIKKKK